MKGDHLIGFLVVTVGSLVILGGTWVTALLVVGLADVVTCDKWLDITVDEVRCDDDTDGGIICTPATETRPLCVIRSGKPLPGVDLGKVPGVKVIPKED